MDNIQNLENKIRKYAESYYNGESEVSDEYFDELVNELRSLNPDSEVLKSVGWGSDSQGSSKASHLYNMVVGSLSKVKSIESIPSDFKPNNSRISAKLDGLSVVSYYSCGKRIMSITRGNGRTGKLVTNKMNVISPETYDLGNDFTGAVRGEVVIDNETWNGIKSRYNDNPSANQRNIASGILNRNDFSEGYDPDLKLLKYVVYKVVADEELCVDLDCYEIYPETVSSKFTIVPRFIYDTGTECWNSDDLVRIYKEFCKTYPCDGLVITNNSVHQKDTAEIVFNEIAYKFQSESKIVEVTDVDWNSTRTGRIVPRVWFNPVELSGAVVRKCTGYNAQFIKDSGIGKGSVIEVCRSNEVIPTILKVISKVEPNLPKNCPNCGYELKWDGVDLVCDNENESQLVYRFISTVGETDGAGWSLYSKVQETFNIVDIDSLVRFIGSYDKSKVESKVYEYISGSVTQAKALEVISKITSDIDPIVFLVACNISGISWTSADKLITDYPEFINDIVDYKVDWVKVSGIKGFGYSTVVALQNFEDRIRKIANVSKFKKHEIEQKVDTQFKVAITGSLSMKRSDFNELLERNGIFQSSNFNEIKFLITNNPDSGSSKMKKAKDHGVEIISESEFVERFLQ